MHPQIGIPIVEKLNYTTNDEIVALFITLLASASDKERVNTARPAFVNIIERLTPDEARIIKYLKGKDEIQHCNFIGYENKNVVFVAIQEHMTLLPFELDLNFPQNVNAYLSNLTSMGILIDMVGNYKADQLIYDKIIQKYNYEEYERELVPSNFESLSIKRGYYKITDFGRLFIKACIK